VIIAGDHVLGPQVGKRNQVHASDFLNIALVALGHSMSQNIGAHPEQSERQEYPEKTVSAGDFALTSAAVRQD
jgi:hypothetical protein